jgi:general secretion pathway protein A
MYKAYFGLHENPFSVNTDPRYLYLTQRTQEALDCLTHGIEARKGFILLTGEVGTGKTTLLNKLLETLHQQGTATAFVFNPRMPASQLFEYMMADFGIGCKSPKRSLLLFKLNQWLLDRYQAGQQTVLVVDEAQILSRQTLEEIRLLTNLETSTEKLLQVVLAGQPEFEQRLNQRELRQLRQRIALRAKTLPLTVEETSGYILERLRIAGSNGEEIFSPAAIEAVHRHARGIPRVTNLLSEQALLRACVAQRKPIPAEIVEDVARDFSLDEVDFLVQPQVLHGNGKNGHGKNGHGRKHKSRKRQLSGSTGENHSGQPDSRPAFSLTQVTLPLFVYGYGADGNPFYENAQTIAMNPRGGLISMNTPVEPGQRLIITNKENECSQECVVEFLGARLARGVDVAFEFSAPMPDFWATRQLAATELKKNPASESEQACA